MTGGELRAWRVYQGLTKASLARMLRVTPVTIFRWERSSAVLAGRVIDLAIEALDLRLARGEDIEDCDLLQPVPVADFAPGRCGVN